MIQQNSGGNRINKYSSNPDSNNTLVNSSSSQNKGELKGSEHKRLLKITISPKYAKT